MAQATDTNPLSVCTAPGISPQNTCSSPATSMINPILAQPHRRRNNPATNPAVPLRDVLLVNKEMVREIPRQVVAPPRNSKLPMASSACVGEQCKGGGVRYRT
eukprot:TRINITY_DN1123_c0_g1_i2.p2 TRINITY_DN1123_c0_g1~~TRINITY_DN1123_c0_g1_i2.p2  ORF type:complete len:103 (-),score=8.78 TRINITY_DN1123_c0_g1_i2:120-428(-)